MPEKGKAPATILTQFIDQNGPRLSEAVFRIAEDPEDTDTHQIALEEVEELRDEAIMSGLTPEEFEALVTRAGKTMFTDSKGQLFIDTREGKEVYLGFPEVSVELLGENQADWLR